MKLTKHTILSAFSGRPEGDSIWEPISETDRDNWKLTTAKCDCPWSGVFVDDLLRKMETGKPFDDIGVNHRTECPVMFARLQGFFDGYPD